MAYTLIIEGNEPLFELEFDRLYAQALNGEWSYVRQRCYELLATPCELEWPHLLLGYIELEARSFAVAYDHFCAGKRLPEPLYSESLAGAGRALLGLSRSDEAFNLLQDVVAKFPESHFGWHALGEIFVSRGEYDSAWGCAQQAVSLCPTHSLSVSLLVSVGTTLGQHAYLAAALVEIQKAQPINLDVRGVRALSLLHEGRHAEAVEEMSRVISFAPFAQVSPSIIEMIRQRISAINKGEA